MPLTEIYRDQNAAIKIDEESSFLQITWLQHPTSDSFRHILELGLQNALDKQLNHWLCDMRKLYYLEIKDQNWLVREIYPVLPPTSQHHLAYVVSKEDLELQTSFRIQELVESNPELNTKLQIEIFFEQSFALQWLQNPT